MEWLMFRSRSAAAAAHGPYVDGDGGYDEHAADHLLPVGGDDEDVEAVVEGLDQQQPQQGAPHRTAAAEQAGPADDDGGDGGEFVAGAQVRRSGDDTRREDDARQPGQAAAEHVHGDQDLPGFHAGDIGRGAVATDRIDAQAERRLAQHQVGDDEAGDHDQYGH